MTPEEMEKAMQFIIEQQAQFAADIQKLTEKQSLLSDATIGNTGMIGRILQVLDRITEEHVKLARAQTELVEAQAQTDSRLNTFIVTVERYISERRNGKG